MLEVHHDGKAVVSRRHPREVRGRRRPPPRPRPLGHDGTPVRDAAGVKRFAIGAERHARGVARPTRSSGCSVACPSSSARCSRARTTTPRALAVPAAPTSTPPPRARKPSGRSSSHPELLRERLEALELITGDAGAARRRQGDWWEIAADARRGAGLAGGAQRRPARARHAAGRHRGRERALDPADPEAGGVRRCTSGSPGCRATSSTPCCERPHLRATGRRGRRGRTRTRRGGRRR